MVDALAEYDFSLPPALIAAHPPARRDGGRLLHVDGGNRVYPVRRLPSLLAAGDLLVVNDSRVVPARLHGKKPGGGRVEILLERFVDAHHCLAQIGAARPPKESTRISTAAGDFIVCGRRDEFYLLAAVASTGTAGGRLADVRRRFLRGGETPLPPYIRRPAAPADKTRYQTLFARRLGSVAAPTAGLHFSAPLLRALAERGVRLARVTLHVGAGTFSPIRGAVERHKMHAETYRITAAAAAAVAAAKRRGGRVVAAGTTVLRVLESAAVDGDGGVQARTATTDLFIRPGFSFRVVDALFTNFHLPRSSLLLLVCAFGGRRRVLSAYRRAVECGMRFYSYGDAMLLAR